MRHESKPEYFKDMASKCRNFINITVNLSNRNQMKQCWEFSSDRFLGDFVSALSKSISVPFSSLPGDLQNVLNLSQSFEVAQFQDKVLQHVSSLLVNGVKYASKGCFCSRSCTR